MIDLKKMLEAGVHFGHKTSRWSPKMRPYIWGARNKVHLVDVSKTAFLLERASTFLKEIVTNGGKVLYVGTKKAAQPIIQRAAHNTQMPFVIHRWVGGTLSNYDQVKKAVTRLLHMRDILQKSTEHYKKKEISMIQKEIARLEKNVGGILDFDYPPAALIIVDPKKEHSAVKEASRLGIPVVALVDTNTDPDGVSFIIPGNDDSPKAISFIVEQLESAVQEGVKAHASLQAKSKAENEAKRLAAKIDAESKRAAAQSVKAPEVKEEKQSAAPEKNAPEAPEKAPAKKVVKSQD